MLLFEQVKSYFNNKHFDNVCVNFLHNYPKNGNHIEIKFTDLHLSIVYGLDPYSFDNNNQITDPNFWYVINNGEVFINKKFSSFECAVKAGIDKLTQQMEHTINTLHNYQTIIS